MEIIKPRTDKQEQVECPTCGATIGYYETEVKEEYLPGHVSRFRIFPPIFLFTYIVCPSCGRRIVLKDARGGAV